MVIKLGNDHLNLAFALFSTIRDQWVVATGRSSGQKWLFNANEKAKKAIPMQ